MRQKSLEVVLGRTINVPINGAKEMSEGLSIKNNFLPGYPGGGKSILRIAIIIIL
jgi:DNA replication protein DnaC